MILESFSNPDLTQTGKFSEKIGWASVVLVQPIHVMNLIVWLSLGTNAAFAQWAKNGGITFTVTTYK